MRVQLGVTIALVHVLFGGSLGMTDLPFTKEWTHNIKSEFCVHVTKDVSNWRAHIIFDQPISKLTYYSGAILDQKNGDKEFVVGSAPHHRELQAGSQFCGHFQAEYQHAKPTSMKLYIEGMDGPIPTPDYHKGNVLWQLKSFDEHDFLKHWNAMVSGQFDEGSAKVVDDPAGGGGKVLRVFYEKGHDVSKHSHRGTQFYGQPTRSQSHMTLSYDIYFDPNFDFVKGGKLPGLFGGWINCTGGRHSDNCFTARLMWRTDGDGELYAYIPKEQTSSFCHEEHCNFDYGNSVGRGTWRFARGKWQTVTEHITLNTPGKKDGFAKIWYNGRLVLQKNNLNFRNKANILIDGIIFSTFFGGHGPDWAPTRDCYTYFKNFVLSTEKVSAPHIIG